MFVFLTDVSVTKLAGRDIPEDSYSTVTPYHRRQSSISPWRQLGPATFRNFQLSDQDGFFKIVFVTDVFGVSCLAMMVKSCEELRRSGEQEE